MSTKNFNRRQFVAAASLSSLSALCIGNTALGAELNSEYNSAIKEKPTWKKIGDSIYGAKADETGPIGGGKGYQNIITSGDYTVDSLESLIDALAKASKISEEEEYKVGMDLSIKLLNDTKKLHHKIHLMTANRFDIASELLS